MGETIDDIANLKFYEGMTDIQILNRRKRCAAVISSLMDDLIPSLRNIAKGHGYALAVHGSLRRDIDVVLVPWIDKPSPPEELVADISDECKRLCQWGNFIGVEGLEKPHNRKCWLISLWDVQLDLSVMLPTPPTHGDKNG